MDDRLEILKLVEAGALETEEALELIDALDQLDRPGRERGRDRSQDRFPPGPPLPPGPPRSRRVIRIKVLSDEGARVNVALPVALVDAGLGIVKHFAPDFLGHLDPTSLRSAILHGSEGTIVDVAGDTGERVQITIE